MQKVEILIHPNPILRKKAKEVGKIDSKVKKVIEQMTLALESSEIEGLALAAPQIGESMRIILVQVKERRDRDNKIIQKAIPLTAYINPIITKYSKERTVLEEGCLSVPYYYGPVERPKKIRFEAISISGKPVKKSTGEILAKIIQHEVDHLDGILFIDRVKDKSKIRKAEKESEEERLKRIEERSKGN